MLLLLLIFTSSAAAFEVKVTQRHYQAEENHNITQEWTFPNTNTSSEHLYILCGHFTKEEASVLYHVHAGVTLSEAQHEHFSGRVQSDTDALREGRIRLKLSRLRTEDSGLYVCEVQTESGYGSASCELIVSAAAQPQTERVTQSQQVVSEGKVGLYLGLMVSAAALLAVFVQHCIYMNKKTASV